MLMPEARTHKLRRLEQRTRVVNTAKNETLFQLRLRPLECFKHFLSFLI
jgi:hypothetical protein